MPAPTTSDGLLRYVLTLLAVVLTITVLYFGRDLILPMVVSGLFAFLLLPVARGLERRMPRWVASLVATLALVLVVLGVFFFLGYQMTRFGADLPMLQAKFASKGELLLERLESYTNLDRRQQIQWFNDHVSGLASWGGQAALTLFQSTGTALASVVPIPFFVFLLLLLKDRFRTFFTKLGTTREGAVLEVMVSISLLSRKYMRGVVLVVLLFGLLCSIGFLLIGLKYAILLAFILAILNMVPYVGALLGSLLPVFVALVTKDSAWAALAALSVVLVVQFLDNNFITPKVVGSSVSINPLASMLALVGFGALWGVAGMLLAIPITGMLKVICDSIPSLHAWGYILGEEIETPKEKRLHLSLPKFGAKPPAHDPSEKH
jgi:predicted PurR-regulated permease PerM